MLDEVVANGAGVPLAAAALEPEPPPADLRARLREWLTAFFERTLARDADRGKLLVDHFRRQYRFLGLSPGERYEVQLVEPDVKDQTKRLDLQRHRFAYTDALKAGLRLLHDGQQEFGFQGAYVIPQVVNPAALSKAAPDTWHLLASGSGTSAKDIMAFLVSYVDFDTVRAGGAKKVSATQDELMLSCERGIEFCADAADILGSPASLAFLFSGNGCQVHVALDRLPHTDEVQAVRAEFVHVVSLLYSDASVVGDDTVCNPNRLCPAAGTLKCKGFNDVKLGRIHRFTGIYCADSVERLTLNEFTGLVTSLRARLTPEQREQLLKKAKGGGAHLVTAVKAPSPTRTGPSPFELANALPVREVYAKLGGDPGHPRCPLPACGADDTTSFIDESLGVQSLKCFHATCGSKSWKNIDLVVVLALGKDAGDQEARREAVNWVAENFPSHNIPKLRKSKTALKVEVDAGIAESGMGVEDLVDGCGAGTTDDDLRPVVEAVQTRDAAPAAALLKALAKKTGIGKRKLLALVKEPTTAPSASNSPDYSDEGWPTKLLRTPKGAIRSGFANAVTVLTHDPRWAGRLAWCEFASRIVLLAAVPWPKESAPPEKFEPGTPWGEPDDHRLVDYLERFYGIGVSPKQAYYAARLAADRRRVHPVREYLGGLVWDGIKRLDALLTTHFGVKSTPYAQKVGPWMFMQAVKRIYEPGCQADYVPVLEGAQGIQKSSAIRALCPNPSWASDTTFTIGSKDAMVALRGRWFIELAEAMTLLRAEHAAAKAFFTSATDDYRPPYGMHNVQVARQCVFFATINPEGGYLRDPTGNRRYWPVLCGEIGSIDIAAIVRDRDQLWAEAVARYRAGERCYPDKDEHAIFGKEQDVRAEEDPWHERIERDLHDLNEVTVAFVLTEVLCIETSRQEPRFQTRVTKVLASTGWRLRGITKVPEDDAEKIKEGKVRKSVRIYARTEAVENPIPFTPGMTRENLLSYRELRATNELMNNV